MMGSRPTAQGALSYEFALKHHLSEDPLLRAIDRVVDLGDVYAESILRVDTPIHAANIQDRDGAPDVLNSIRSRWPWLRHIFADGGYAGDKLQAALAHKGRWTLEIIKRSDTAEGIEVLPRRWVVERAFAWLGRCRRLAKDWEKTIASATAFLLIAHVRLLTRRIASHCAG